MSRKYQITLEVEMPDASTTSDALLFASALIDTAFKKKNPVPCPPYPLPRNGWRAEVAMPPSEHPYRPKVLDAVEVAQPAPRPR